MDQLASELLRLIFDKALALKKGGFILDQCLQVCSLWKDIIGDMRDYWQGLRLTIEGMHQRLELFPESYVHPMHVVYTDLPQRSPKWEAHVDSLVYDHEWEVLLSTVLLQGHFSERLTELTCSCQSIAVAPRNQMERLGKKCPRVRAFTIRVLNGQNRKNLDSMLRIWPGLSMLCVHEDRQAHYPPGIPGLMELTELEVPWTVILDAQNWVQLLLSKYLVRLRIYQLPDMYLVSLTTGVAEYNDDYLIYAQFEKEIKKKGFHLEFHGGNMYNEYTKK